MFYVVGPGASRGPADGGAAVGGALGVCSSLATHPGSLMPPTEREEGSGEGPLAQRQGGVCAWGGAKADWGTHSDIWALATTIFFWFGH